MKLSLVFLSLQMPSCTLFQHFIQAYEICWLWLLNLSLSRAHFFALAQSCTSSFWGTTASWHTTNIQTYYILKLSPLLAPISVNYNMSSSTWAPKLNYFILISPSYILFQNDYKFQFIISSLLLASPSIFYSSSLGINYLFPTSFNIVLNGSFPCI